MKTIKDRHKVRFLSTLVALGLGLWTGLVGLASPAKAALSDNIGIRAHILNPPNPITDLGAAPVGLLDGDVQLSWTAPSNDNYISINHYLVRYATFPAPSVGQAETWWTNAAPTQSQISPAFAPGTLEFTTINGLSIGVTYYFGIKSVDNDGSISPIDSRTGTGSQANSIPLNTSSPPNTPNNFAGVALSTTSLQWSWDASPSAGFYTVYEFPSGALINQTTNTFLIEASLSPDTAYTRHVRAANGAGMSPASVAQTVYTLANIPTSLATTSVGFTTVSLAWGANGNPASTTYRLERSLDDTNFVIASQQTGTSFQDTGLTEQTTYYYRVRAINGDGIQTSPTSSIVVVTPLQLDFVPPDAPLGLKGSLDASGRAFTLIWEAVTQNQDGTPTDDLAGYHIYRRSTLFGSRTQVTSSPVTATVFADQVDGQLFYYTITAIDTSGNESSESMLADSSILANVIFASSSSLTSLTMPSSVNDLMRSAFNKYGVPLALTLQEVAIPQDTNVVRSVRFDLLRGDTKEIIEDLAFAAPQSIVSIGYNVQGGEVVGGAPSVSNAPTFKATPQDLSIYWFNGVTWVKAGGTLDTASQSVKIKSSFLGNYQLRIAQNAVSLTLDKGNVFPRVFTPNGDGQNDRVYFVLQNPNESNVVGEIFDTAGRYVATLPPPSDVTGIGTTLIWDGRDMNGAVVPSGAYIYRIKGEGKTFTGTVGVAR